MKGNTMNLYLRNKIAYYSSQMTLKQHDKHIAKTKLYNTIKHYPKLNVVVDLKTYLFNPSKAR